MTIATRKFKNDMYYIPDASELKNVCVKDYEKVALMLSKIARKNPPWSWRYVESFLRGTIRPGKKFLLAWDKLIVDIRIRPRAFHVKHKRLFDMPPKELLWCLKNRTEMK